MSKPLGTFVWYELLTTDPTSALAFYTQVIGWRAAAFDDAYTILSTDQAPVAGLMGLPQAVRDGSGRPFWMGYIGVDDVDAAVARLTQAGGTLHRAPADIPGVGRFAVVADPQGAPFTLFTPASPAPAAPAAGFTPGHVGWHELHAADRETALAFYAGQYGWTKAGEVDMGPIGIYQMFATGAAAVGGMMTKTAAFPDPVWVFYINVDNIEAAIARAIGAGGQRLNGPHQVPGGAWIAQCLDPQGAFFAMVAPEQT